MFRRRQKHTSFHRARDFFWPRAGWHRSTRYVFHRVARIPGSSYSLAAGFACGAAISFTPFLGLHFVLAALLAYVIRANVIASAIGTVVGNPWTFPFIWFGVYELGSWMTDMNGLHAHQVDFLEVLTESMQAMYAMDMRYLADVGLPVLLPMLAGCVPFGILVWVLSYVALRPMIAKYQSARYHRRMKGLERRRKRDAERRARQAEAEPETEVETD